MGVYDLDWAFYFHKNAFEDLLTENLRETNQIIRPLLKNSEYRVYFLERLAYQIKNTLQNEKILAVIEEYERLLEPEIDRERALWGGSRSRVGTERRGTESLYYGTGPLRGTHREHYECAAPDGSGSSEVFRMKKRLIASRRIP